MRRTHNISGTTDSEWLALCDDCLLPDGCIRGEGDFIPARIKKKQRPLIGCLIYEAASRSIAPSEALDRLVVTAEGVRAI